MSSAPPCVKSTHTTPHLNLDFVNTSNMNWADVSTSEPVEQGQPNTPITPISPISDKSFHQSNESNWRQNETHVYDDCNFKTNFVKKWNRFSKNNEDHEIVRNNPYVTSTIKLFDVDANRTLVHYETCDITSDDKTKATRGVIRNNDRIVCKTFGYTPEYTVTDDVSVDVIRNAITSFNQCKFYSSEEGCLIRVFYDQNQWHICTHRKLDAFKSRWGDVTCASFGQMFVDGLVWHVRHGSLQNVVIVENDDDVLNCFTSKLNTNCTYTFLVRNNTKNRIVCTVPEHPVIYFIGAFDTTTHFLIEGNTTGIPMPNKYEFDDVEQLIAHVRMLDPFQSQGIAVFMPNQTQLKVMNSEYMNMFNARGNEPNIKFRYLQVRGGTPNEFMLRTLYPEFVHKFDLYEDILYECCELIYQSYVSRYIRHEYSYNPQLHFFIMKDAHTFHCTDRANNRVTLEKIIELVNQKDATYLNKLIKLHVSAINTITNQNQIVGVENINQ